MSTFMENVLPWCSISLKIEETSKRGLKINNKKKEWKQANINSFIYFGAFLNSEGMKSLTVRVGLAWRCDPLKYAGKSWTGRERSIFLIIFCPFNSSLRPIYVWALNNCEIKASQIRSRKSNRTPGISCNPFFGSCTPKNFNIPYLPSSS